MTPLPIGDAEDPLLPYEEPQVCQHAPPLQTKPEGFPICLAPHNYDEYAYTLKRNRYHILLTVKLGYV